MDVNTLSKDGTRALDWWYPSENGRYVAYGVSANGDEESVLHVHDVQTGKDLADTITRTRAASVAWRPDHKSFYYTRYPLPGTVPAGEEKYHRHVYFHRLGSDPAQDPKIFGDGPGPEGLAVGDAVARRALAGHRGVAGLGQERAVPARHARRRRAKPVAMVEGKPSLYRVAEVLNDRIYVVSNEGAPRYRVFAADVKQARSATPGRRSSPRARRRWRAISVVGGKTLAALYLKDASSRVRLFDTAGKPTGEIALPTLGTATGLSAQQEGQELFFGFTLVPGADADLPVRPEADAAAPSGRSWPRPSTPTSSRCGRCATRRRTAPRCRCSWSTARG